MRVGAVKALWKYGGKNECSSGSELEWKAYM
jgi:hypothetical protein